MAWRFLRRAAMADREPDAAPCRRADFLTRRSPPKLPNPSRPKRWRRYNRWKFWPSRNRNTPTKLANLGLEGEVLVQVVFPAAGPVQVVRVIKGLGYGLDEAAIHAAEQIRFKPAQQDGKPVDYPATVHIVFQIAY